MSGLGRQVMVGQIITRPHRLELIGLPSNEGHATEAARTNGGIVFEVFNAVSGETIGFTEHKATAVIMCGLLDSRTGIMHDYINADEESGHFVPDFS